MRTKIKAIKNLIRGKLYSINYKIGKRTRIGRVRMSGPKNSITIGNGVHISRDVDLAANKGEPIVIGDNSFINQKTMLRPHTYLGKNVFVGQKVTFLTDSHEIGPSYKRAGSPKKLPIQVGDGCWIGANVTIVGPVIIGKGTIIGAGAVVTKDVPENVIVAGVPAKIIKNLN